MSNDWLPDLRRLRVLAELARLGSMRAVADELGYTTSTVSQQIANLGREVGEPLVEREGRGIRLTPVGRRLAEQAEVVLAAVAAARSAVGTVGEPAGTVRVAAFASAIRRLVIPTLPWLAAEHPNVALTVAEHEPVEALALLRADAADIAVVYDYDLAPGDIGTGLVAHSLWEVPWGVGVAASAPGPADPFADHDADWIVNSRHDADERVVRLLASRAGFAPRITHRADSLDLVAVLVGEGLGRALFPLDHGVPDAVRILPLEPQPRLRARAVTRASNAHWAPLRCVTDRWRAVGRAAVSGSAPSRSAPWEPTVGGTMGV